MEGDVCNLEVAETSCSFVEVFFFLCPAVSFSDTLGRALAVEAVSADCSPRLAPDGEAVRLAVPPFCGPANRQGPRFRFPFPFRSRRPIHIHIHISLSLSTGSMVGSLRSRPRGPCGYPPHRPRHLFAFETVRTRSRTRKSRVIGSVAKWSSGRSGKRRQRLPY